MANNGHDNDDDDRKDLTRIEDLSEFLHEEDPDLESKFGDLNPENKEATNTELAAGIDLDELESSSDLDILPELPPESPTDDPSSEFQESQKFEEELNFDTGSFESNESLDLTSDAPFELSSDDNDFQLSSDEILEEVAEETEVLPEETYFREPSSPEYKQEEFSSPEKFEDVKTFAQNFSYGQIQGGGNPPFSLVIKNLKFEEERDDIISLLSEFGLVNDQNLDETKKALEIGALLVPQISEYSAIVLAHKLRRFDCDIEMGLSDEVHPSKSKDFNPRGLIKKESLHQNKVESYNKNEEDIHIKEIIVSTTPTLEGYIVKKYIGVQTSFAIVDEDELERLKYVQEAYRSDFEIHNYETDEEKNLSSERAYNDYQEAFEHLFVDLADQLKGKAAKEKANALLGLNYQLTTLPFEKTNRGKNCYQLTCSATLAIVRPE